MSNDFQLNATARKDVGKGASRRLRRNSGVTPAIIYGGKKDPEMISILSKDLTHALENEAFYSHIVTMTVEGNNQEVILKDLQRHPSKPVILHADFFRVSKDVKLETNVPLHFINEEIAIGVKQQGGIVSHNITELEIRCLPADLPEYIEVDMANMELGDSLHISDIKLPKGVESVELSHGEEHDLAVANIIKPRGMEEEAASDEASEDDEASAKDDKKDEKED